MRRLHPRALTLVELVITVAVASLVITAVVASGITMVQFTQGQGRRSAAEATLSLALSQLERRMSNAGVGFANARFAARMRNNVAAGTLPNYDGSTTDVVTRGAAGAGIIAGTDVLEVAMSPSGMRRTGLVSVARTGNNVRLATADPFLEDPATPNELTAPSGQIVLFTDPWEPQDACLARLTAAASPSNPNLQLEFLDDDLASAGAGPNCLSGAACPCTPDSEVYVLEQKVRIVVFQQANGADTGLYLQESTGPGTFGNVFTPLALGVENMQVSPVVGPLLDGGNLAVEGCTATAIAGAVPNWNVCRCNTAPAAPCVLGDNALPQPEEAYVRSMTIELTARAERIVGARLPASFDAPQGPVDDLNRMRASASVQIPNPYLPMQ